MRKIIVTKSLEALHKMGAPTCQGVDFIYDSLLFPKALQFNRTYYKLYRGKLTAFRILAYAVKVRARSARGIDKLHYLVQMPAQDPEWIPDFICDPIFESKEAFFAHQIHRNNVALEWVCGRVAFPELAYAAVTSARGRVWVWDSQNHRPTNEFHPCMEYFVVGADGVYIGLREGHYFLSKQDCIKARLDGIEIDEFKEEPFIVKIDVLPSDKVVHTLKFVED